MTTRSPHNVALLDQYQAAHNDACKRITALTEHLSGHVIPTSAAEPTRIIIRKFVTRLVTDGVTFCSHITPSSPSPAHWSPWAPGRLRCADCHSTAGTRSFQNAKRYNKCDACGIDHGRALHAVLTSTPAVAVTANNGGDPWIVPPTMITYSMCGNCAQTQPRERPA